MLGWFVPENTWIVAIVAVVIALAIVLLMRKRNIEYPRWSAPTKGTTF